jgi:integrase
VETIHRVLEFCDPELRALVCLSRFAALRCPSESMQLRWSDVDRIKRTFVVRSPKTEGHGKGHRLVPLVPEVEQALELLWQRVPEGASDLVFARYAARTGVGAILRKHLERAFNRAGFDLPPKPWHNMRATCVNEWSELYPSHVVCDWAGHTEAVSLKHYRVTTDAHFQKAVSQPSRIETVQNRVQQQAATACSDSQAVSGDDTKSPDLLGIAIRDEMPRMVDCTRRDSNPQPTVPKTVALSN